jgi:phage host-nuclease inhibitor protein Gam
MANRKKKKFEAIALVLSSEEAMLGALNRYIELSLKLARKKAKLDAEIARLNTEFDNEHQESREEIASLESGIQLYAVNYRADLFPDGKKKSREFPNATIGFRDTPPSVGKVITRDTWEAVALRLDSLKWGEEYVVWTAAPDKEALLRDRADLTIGQLSEAGIKFESSETFYIAPSSDAVERSQIDVEEVKAA